MNFSVELFYQWLLEEEVINEEELTLEDLIEDLEGMAKEWDEEAESIGQLSKERLAFQDPK
ncbi:MAG: protein of unknown function DUF3213 [CRESS virus sp. ctYls24]|nr:MAG: protein of unknown function DUF3213 [CRESS virus sp. ctYls24]